MDNAKFLLIALVVVGHLIEPLSSSAVAASVLYRWLYLFHVPALVLASGVVARTRFDNDTLRRILFTLVVPYLLFETLYAVFHAWVFDTPYGLPGFVTPYWLLWYLVSLACWRLMLPVFADLRWPITFSLILSVCIAAFDDIGYGFSFSRTLYFFPFFLIGHRLGAEGIERLGTSIRAKIAAFVGLGALGGIAVVIWKRDISVGWLYGSYGNAALEVSNGHGVLMRLGLLAAAVVGAFSFLALVPKTARLSAFGTRSLAAFVLHGFVCQAMRGFGIYEKLGLHFSGRVQLVFLVLFGVVLTVLLSSSFVSWLASPLLKPERWVRAVFFRRAPRTSDEAPEEASTDRPSNIVQPSA